MNKTPWQPIQEGEITITVPLTKTVTKDLPVFYNPVMKLNRDIAINLIKATGRKHLNIVDPLAGSGIRALRFLKELPKNSINTLYLNDANKNSLRTWKQTVRRNKLTFDNVVTGNTDASVFMLTHPGADYIDIDPFGSPNPFLDAACKRISKNGILAITATDTAALAGSAPRACKRKYDAIALRDNCMHETGIRILCRKAQLIAAQYEKALEPIFCHATAHYDRIYLKNTGGGMKVDNILAQQGMWQNAGPLWKGKLWDTELTKAMLKIVIKNATAQETAGSEERKLLTIIEKEASIPTIGFYSSHEACKQLHINVPPTTDILHIITKQGHKAAITHFSPEGIRTTMTHKQFLTTLRKAHKAQ